MLPFVIVGVIKHMISKSHLHYLYAVGILLATSVPLASASIVISNSNDADNESQKVWTITGLNSTPPGVGGGAATGTLGGGGLFTVYEGLTITARAYYGWDPDGGSSPAQQAATGGTLTNYLATLDPVEMDAVLVSFGGHFGVNSSSVTTDVEQVRFSGVSEVMVFTVDTSSLESTSSLLIEQLAFNQYTSGDRTDFVIYDVSGDSIIEAQWDQDYNNSGDAVNGSWIVEDGDLIVVATGASNTDNFRMNGLGFVTLNVTSSLTGPPPPSSPAPSGPGFANTNQVAGTMLADFNTDSSGVDSVVRTVVLDWIDGYLYMDTRALTTDGSSHTVHTWDLSDPSNPVEAGRFAGERGQHLSLIHI